MTEDVIATWADAKTLGYCGKGLRDWFGDGSRGMTYLDFIKDGASCAWLRAQNDAMADKLADYAEERVNHGGR